MGSRQAESWATQTPQGAAEVELTRPDGAPGALLALGHGAGGHVDTPDLRAVRAAALTAGLAVARITQPYRVAGRRSTPPPPRLDQAWTAVLAALRAEPDLAGIPLIAGGRSSGARVACRTGRYLGAVGVVALAFPLHPPGRPEKSRVDELLGAELPTLVVQGERDAFGRPDEFPPQQTLTGVPDADHGFAVPKRAATSPDDALAAIVGAVESWLGRRVRR